MTISNILIHRHFHDKSPHSLKPYYSHQPNILRTFILPQNGDQCGFPFLINLCPTTHGSDRCGYGAVSYTSPYLTPSSQSYFRQHKRSRHRHILYPLYKELVNNPTQNLCLPFACKMYPGNSSQAFRLQGSFFHQQQLVKIK